MSSISGVGEGPPALEQTVCAKASSASGRTSRKKRGGHHQAHLQLSCMTGHATIGAVSTKPKRPRDPNQLAKLIADISTGKADNDSSKKKDPAAVALGRKGGKKGGRARADKLSPEERTRIARKAAAARWSKK